MRGVFSIISIKNEKYKLMKYLILILFTTVLTAQNTTIETLTNSFFYKGISNPIRVSVKGNDNNSIQIKTDNGSVERVEDNDFFIKPEKTGNIKISIYDKSNTKIGEKLMYVIDLPLKAVLLFPYDKDYYPLIKRARGLDIVPDHPNITLNISPKPKYQILILRDKNIIFNTYFESLRFNDEVKQKLLNLKSGDILIIRDITIFLKKDVEEIKISDLSFKI